MENVNFGKKIENKERVKTIEIEIDGVKYPLECVSYDFEYPKNVQEETGILGYERTKINQASLESFVGSESEQKDHFFYNLLAVLSDGEYPKYCYNHKMGYYADIKTKERYLEYFNNNKFFLDKIYSLENIQEEKKHKLYAFSNTTESRDIKNHANITVYDKISKEVISPGESIPLSKILNYENKIASGDVYASTTHSGLNFTPGDFFHGMVNFEKIVSFGFPFEADNFLDEYLRSVFLEFINLEKSDENETAEVAAKLIISDAMKNGYLNDIELFIKRNSRERIPENEKLQHKLFLIEKLNFIFKNQKDSIDNKKLEKIKDFIYNRVHTSIGGIIENDNMSTTETNLPIFIGHDKIPQLSWGHAKYANYFNEQGFNFFKFKHADHLPTKKTKE